jgi:hypothetical protein
MNIILSRSLHKAIYMDKQFGKGYFIASGKRDQKPCKGRLYVEDVDGGGTCCNGTDADVLPREQ